MQLWGKCEIMGGKTRKRNRMQVLTEKPTVNLRAYYEEIRRNLCLC